MGPPLVRRAGFAVDDRAYYSRSSLPDHLGPSGARIGTISLHLDTFLAVVEDMVRGIYRQGFRHLVILNGHGGNDPARTRLTEIIEEMPGLIIRWYAWWVAPHVTEVAVKHGLKSYHAAWIDIQTIFSGNVYNSINVLEVGFIRCGGVIIEPCPFTLLVGNSAIFPSDEHGCSHGKPFSGNILKDDPYRRAEGMPGSSYHLRNVLLLFGRPGPR